MKYHQGKRFGLSEEKQSYIYWLCVNIKNLSPRKQRAIEKIIEECSEGQYDALFDAICTKKSLTEISMKRYISEAGLQRMCERFYRKAAEKL